MTKQEAKELAIEKWTIFANSEFGYCKLPTDLWEKLRKLQWQCSMCELFYRKKYTCTECPICIADKSCVTHESSLYKVWHNANGDDKHAKRRDAARKILDIIKAWEVDECTN